MTLVAARVKDIGPMQVFLRKHLQTSMFLLGSLHKFGLENNAPHGMRFWIWSEKNAIRAVIGVGNLGVLFVQVPENISDFWRHARRVLTGIKLVRVVGEAPQAKRALAGLGMPDHGISWQGVEPGYALELENLEMPRNNGAVLLNYVDGPREIMAAWRRDYRITILATPLEEVDRAVAQDIEIFAEEDSHRVLMQDDRPLAMTGFNTSTPDVVQVGGVYTPPEARGKGHARVALALHLVEARALGVKTALLFAANEAAAKSYRAVGFRPNGELMTIIFKSPIEVSP